MSKRRISKTKVGDSRGVETREKLLDAAATLFADQGISATTVAKIASHVGVTSAMVHYYFKTREQLLDAFVQERIVQFINCVWEPISEYESDPVVMIEGVINRISSCTESSPWLPPLWIREVVNEGGLLRQRVQVQLPLEKAEQFIKTIQKGQQKGVINQELDPRLMFMSIFGLTLLPLSVARSLKDIPNLSGVGKEDILRHATALILHGVLGSNVSK